MIQAKTTSKVQLWNPYLRVRVGDSVNYAGNTYINKTGINSEPTNTTNWDFVSSSSLLFVRISGLIVDAFGKTDLGNFEVNDVFDGWIGDRRVSGKVISLPFDPNTDLDDNSKCKLAIDSTLSNF